MLKNFTSGLGRLFRFPALTGGVFSTAFSLSKLAAVVFAALLFFAPDKLTALGPNWQSSYGTAAVSAALIAALFALIRALSSGVSLIFWFVIVAALAFKIAPNSLQQGSFSQRVSNFMSSTKSAPAAVAPMQQPVQQQVKVKGPQTKAIGEVGEAFWFNGPIRVQPTAIAQAPAKSDTPLGKLLDIDILKLNPLKKTSGNSAFADYDDSIYYGKKQGKAD